MPNCIDGPLAGERHDQGPSFEFDGRAIGEESGFYTLKDGEYRWNASPARESIGFAIDDAQFDLF